MMCLTRSTGDKGRDAPPQIGRKGDAGIPGTDGAKGDGGLPGLPGLDGKYLVLSESAGGVVVTTSACHAADAGRTGSIPGTGSCDIKIWLSTLGTVYPS